MRTHTDRDIRMLVARSSVGQHHVPLSLARADLEMANLPHVDLRGADLAGANLRGAMLEGAILDGACLDGADLSCANLTWGSLRGCSMKGALLVEANLDETVVDTGFSEAVTVGAGMITLTFTREVLLALAQEEQHRQAAAPEQAREDAARRSRDEAVWSAHVQRAHPPLRARPQWPRAHDEIEMAYARVLTDSDLRELLRWSAATGKPLNLRGCNLSEASLRNAPLQGACLRFTDATRADTQGADLAGADLEDARGWKRS